MQTPVAQAQSIVWPYSSSREPILIAYGTVQAKDKYKKAEKSEKRMRKTATERNRKKDSDKVSEQDKVRKEERKRERKKSD